MLTPRFNLVGVLRCEKTKVLCKQRCVRDLRQRSNRDIEEPSKLTIPSLRDAFSDVRCNREGGAPELRGEPVEFVFRKSIGYAIDGQREFVCSLPRCEFLVGHHAMMIGGHREDQASKLRGRHPNYAVMVRLSDCPTVRRVYSFMRVSPRPRQQILDNLDSVYREAYERAKAAKDERRMADLDAAYQREQLLLEVLLDIRDGLTAPAKPKPPSDAGSSPIAAIDTIRRIAKLR